MLCIRENVSLDKVADDLLLNKQYGATMNREKARTNMFARPNVTDRRTSVQQLTRAKSNQKQLFTFRQ